MTDESGHLGDLAAQEGSRRRRRTAITVGSVLAVVLLGALVGALVWQQYVSSPLYTLKLLEQAVSAQDPVGVATYYDAKAVAGDLYAAAAADLGRGAFGEEHGWLVEGLATVVEPLVVDRLADQLLATILENPQAAQERLIPSPAEASIERDGSKAVAAVPLATDREARFVMLKAGNRWRVVGIENAAEVHRDLLDAVGLNVSEWIPAS